MRKRFLYILNLTLISCISSMAHQSSEMGTEKNASVELIEHIMHFYIVTMATKQ